MFQQRYVVPKRSGTFADILTAYGLGTLLRTVGKITVGQRADRVAIRDHGAYYSIDLPMAPDEGWLHIDSPPRDLVKYIVRKSGSDIPAQIETINYNELWDNIRKRQEIQKAQRSAKGAAQQQTDQLAEEFYQPDTDVALLIGDYRMQVEGINNQAVLQWDSTVKAGYFPVNMRAILQCFVSLDTDIDAVARAWSKEVAIDGVKPRLTASQVFNPGSGKGQNRPKANQLTMGNTDSFWLLEYLKAAGMFVASAPRSFTAEGIRKTYVLAPADILLRKHNEVFEGNDQTPGFKRYLTNAESPLKADILHVLGYATTYFLAYRTSGDSLDDANFDLSRTVQGFAVATYRLLSQNSYTMVNMAFLGMPSWINNNIRTLEDVDVVLGVLEEHRRVIRPLREKFQEEYDLLDLYRDFLTGHRIEAFFAFCVAYGEFLVRKITVPLYRALRQFSVPLLDELFRRLPSMENVDINDFLNDSDSGFHRIAYAIRHSTVVPQRQKAHNQRPLYDIRYGLGHNLRRKTDTDAEFLSALGEFVHLYNAETSQVLEVKGEQRRKLVRTDDLNDVLNLTKKYGAVLVCNMLLAYGYASQGKKAGEGDINSASSDSEEPANAD